ncbi:MRPL36 [Branchiostoma lanceolatum]|uniref:Large ribosomal subunit protein bL36m n=1 Tax=Branchiostoma lanceolatum TaxID=7740 RepID=A0A8K0AB67_BRALA|nr:MRPL36 [Branchiostoma lanceolatum]
MALRAFAAVWNTTLHSRCKMALLQPSWSQPSMKCSFSSLFQPFNIMEQKVSSGFLQRSLLPPQMTQIAGYKYKVYPRLRCRSCYFLKIRGVLHVHCKTHQRHKQIQLPEPKRKPNGFEDTWGHKRLNV